MKTARNARALLAVAVSMVCAPALLAQDLALPEGSFTVVNLVWLAEGAEARQSYARYLGEATPILEEHGGDLTLELVVESAWVGESPPDRVTIVTWPDAEALRAFVTDPRYREVVGLRDQALARSEAYITRKARRSEG